MGLTIPGNVLSRLIDGHESARVGKENRWHKNDLKLEKFPIFKICWDYIFVQLGLNEAGTIKSSSVLIYWGPRQRHNMQNERFDDVVDATVN